eukprot:SAG22_NODE_231_length_14551_cov_22.298090_15_plen_93_part_00
MDTQEHMTLGIPFMALLPFDWKGNKKSGAFIREHKIQEIVCDGRVLFENGKETTGAGRQNTAWYCYGLDLPNGYGQWCVGQLEGKMDDVKTI